jgi:hypothetical protein
MTKQTNKWRFDFSRIQSAIIISIIDSLVIYFIVMPALAFLEVTLNWNLPAIIVVMFTLNFYFRLNEMRLAWSQLKEITEQGKRTFNLSYYLTTQEVARQQALDKAQQLPRTESNDVDFKD